ncbi:MAG: DCC1-like thiol-disulfide oxidoreductase family protein [Candidatus Omnitrophota bacterium]|nr:DCC1-like thiol-disulfide oxidoreductase family protein [Candidatus Omnitrophota bacterium]MDZ4243394.1 DCC1-like thiol-disulfide oxidoreductase family protein [Candidatus Omnitrophota bacterium]
MTDLWHKLFLQERASLGLGLFRIAVALTTGFHVLPGFFHLDDTYYHTAFKTHDTISYTPQFLELVQRSPDGLVLAFVVLFCVSWFFFLIGLFTQFSGIVLLACCYYFHALNEFVAGALSWYILVVTLFQMCLTPYPGDYFSVDCLRRGSPDAYKTPRPFFLQRLLQMQIALIYFYTGLIKVSAEGNWLRDNPVYDLMHTPPEGVTKFFLLRDFFAGHPGLCYAVGVLIIAIELSMPFLLFCRRTRVSAITLGFVFHVTLILTLDVPAVFFFLFPAQLLLFLRPEDVVRWIDQKRRFNQSADAARLVYDGRCGFCRASVDKLKVMDLFAVLKFVDYQTWGSVSQIHPRLTRDAAHSQLHLVEPDGTLYGGFFAFRRLCWTLPMLWPLLPFVYFPGAGVAGPVIYRWIARNRYLFHDRKVCRDNACFR